MGKFSIGKRVECYSQGCGAVLDKSKGQRLVDFDDPARPSQWIPKQYLAPTPQLEIEAGKSYFTIGGKAIGPIELSAPYPYKAAGGPRGTIYYRKDGTCNLGANQPGHEEYTLLSEDVSARPKKCVSEFSAGDYVRFTTEDPSFGAEYFDGEMKVLDVFSDELKGMVDLLYPYSGPGGVPLSQLAAVEDITHAH